MKIEKLIAIFGVYIIFSRCRHKCAWEELIMMVTLCRAKIHRATITEANLNYEGSITIDRSLMDAAGLMAFEKVHVVNINTGSRLETYVIEGVADSGTICLNGAAARLGAAGDKIIIIAYGQFTTEEASDFKPALVRVDKNNRVIEK